jgi:hypothetical protein
MDDNPDLPGAQHRVPWSHRPCFRPDIRGVREVRGGGAKRDRRSEGSTLSSSPTRPELAAAVKASLIAAFANGRPDSSPFRHWLVAGVFPEGMTRELIALPFACPDLGGVSGKREFHNDQRHYFDAGNNSRFRVCAAVAEAFQSAEVATAIETVTGADLAGTYVRLEHAQDTDGFWLQPHTDLGVKRFTMLIYLSNSPEQADLGTDIFSDPQTWAARSPFTDNTALVFVPGANTWHGLTRRPIAGVRRTIIMNYVTDEWRAREQLAYPTSPVRA